MRIRRGVVWGLLTGHSDEAKYVHTYFCMRVNCFVIVVETQRRVWVLFTTNVLCCAGGDIINTVYVLIRLILLGVSGFHFTVY